MHLSIQVISDSDEEHNNNEVIWSVRSIESEAKESLLKERFFPQMALSESSDSEGDAQEEESLREKN
jgi:hypothetical protein